MAPTNKNNNKKKFLSVAQLPRRIELNLASSKDDGHVRTSEAPFRYCVRVQIMPFRKWILMESTPFKPPIATELSQRISIK